MAENVTDIQVKKRDAADLFESLKGADKILVITTKGTKTVIYFENYNNHDWSFLGALLLQKSVETFKNIF